MPLSEDDFEYICELVNSHTGICLRYHEESRLAFQLGPVIDRAGLSSLKELIIVLRASPYEQIHLQVIESLLVSETYFFRDFPQFEALQKLILPQYLKQRQRKFNIWCAACSSGQEAYSIAMLIHKYFPIISSSMHLIGSDISTEMLSRAIGGCFTQKEVDRGLPLTFLNRYFKKYHNQWFLSEEIRSLVYFRQINLVENWPPLPQMDIIFMRNVLIYFDVEKRKAILEQVRQLLHPDGYLFLGAAETTTLTVPYFKPVHFEKAVCYRRKE
ncbi:MAG TPA: protein-glutamate O-methyltransferase CheR [Halomicronema sp.]